MTTQTTAKPQPRTGKGSPAGPRWFVSGSPELSMTVKPQDIVVSDTGKERPQKAVRLYFQRQAKPQKFIGTGMLGRANQGEGGGDGTDRNQPAMWGVLYTDNQAVIDWLREHEMYKRTVQDNMPEVNLQLKLKELDWDPRAVSGNLNGTVRRSGEAQETGDEELPQAPVDAGGARPAARVGLRANEGV